MRPELRDSCAWSKARRGEHQHVDPVDPVDQTHDQLIAFHRTDADRHVDDLDDTALILIDHQVGTNTWAASTPLELTWSEATNVDVQGRLVPELEAGLNVQVVCDACGSGN